MSMLLEDLNWMDVENYLKQIFNAAVEDIIQKLRF